MLNFVIYILKGFNIYIHIYFFFNQSVQGTMVNFMYITENNANIANIWFNCSSAGKQLRILCHARFKPNSAFTDA